MVEDAVNDDNSVVALSQVTCSLIRITWFKKLFIFLGKNGRIAII